MRDKELQSKSPTIVGGDITTVAAKDRGFTLIELLVVVVIMGILSTVSVLAVGGLADQSQESACDSDKRVLEVAIETWFADSSLASGTLSEQALVTAGLLRALSPLHDVGSNGSVTATAGAACVGV